MTKKDYELIAKAIRDTQARINAGSIAKNSLLDQLRGVRRTAAHLSDALAVENPRFDAGRFLAACGYGA